MTRRRRNKLDSLETTIELDVAVEVEIEPGEKETPRTFDCGGTPGCGPSATILSVMVGGVSIPLSALPDGEIERLEAQAVEAYEDDDGCDDDDAEYERQRDRSFAER